MPIAASVEMKIHGRICIAEKVTPLLAETKRVVIKINAAHPFMLMIEQSGKLKFAVFSEILKLDFEHCKERGRVALEDFVKKAVVRAGIIAFASLIGEIPFLFKIIGRTMNP